MLLQVGVDARDGGAYPAVRILRTLVRKISVAMVISGSTAKVTSASFHCMRIMIAMMPASTKTSSKIDTTPGGEHLVQRIDVAGDSRHQPSDGIAVEKAHVHALQVAEDLGAQVEHRLLPRPLHEIGLAVFEPEAQQQRGDVERGDLPDAGEGVLLRYGSSMLLCAPAVLDRYLSTTTRVR